MKPFIRKQRHVHPHISERSCSERCSVTCLLKMFQKDVRMTNQVIRLDNSSPFILYRKKAMKRSLYHSDCTPSPSGNASGERALQSCTRLQDGTAGPSRFLQNLGFLNQPSKVSLQRGQPWQGRSNQGARICSSMSAQCSATTALIVQMSFLINA